LYRPKPASRRSSVKLGVTNLYDAVATNYVHQLGQALRAKELYHRDKDYLVDAGEVKIVDELRDEPSTVDVGPTDCTKRSRPRNACASKRRTTPGRR